VAGSSALPSPHDFDVTPRVRSIEPTHDIRRGVWEDAGQSDTDCARSHDRSSAAADTSLGPSPV